MMALLSPVASPDSRKKYALTGDVFRWSHMTMDSAEANAQLLRLFGNVKVPTLQYAERILCLKDVRKIRPILRTREKIIKSGINTITASNAGAIYQSFKPILEERAVCHVS
jgi:hypothetical protein